MDDPFDLKVANGLTLITAILLLGMTRVITYKEFRKVFQYKKRAMEEFIASNQSKKTGNLTLHFIT